MPQRGKPGAQGGKVDIGGGQLGGGKAAQHRRQHQRTHRRQPLFGPDAPHGQPAQGGENGTRPRKKAAKRQGEAPGQGIQRGQHPGVPLGQHAAAGQHAPDGQQMPRQLLHKTKEVKCPGTANVTDSASQHAAQSGVSLAAVRRQTRAAASTASRKTTAKAVMAQPR
ncbi:MAG: hypothetical protein EP147_00105 [Subdoligranulum sp.]|nr:hypothetical protein [Subdoligranulum sp.]